MNWGALNLNPIQEEEKNFIILDSKRERAKNLRGGIGNERKPMKMKKKKKFLKHRNLRLEIWNLSDTEESCFHLSLSFSSFFGYF
jgi:methyl coenzyme M reductase beta subunit